MPKGLSVQQFDMWYNKTHFQVAGKNELFHRIHRRLLTQKKLDVALIFIMDLALTARSYPRPTTSTKLPKELEPKRLLGAITTIRKSPLSPLLAPTAEEIVRSVSQMRREKASDTAKRLITLKLQSNNWPEFLAALALLDAYPSTKPTRHVESFFVCLLSKRLKQTTEEANWSLVCQIVEMCFGGKPKAKTLAQRVTDFTKAFPSWPTIAKKIYREAERKKLLGWPLASPFSTPLPEISFP